MCAERKKNWKLTISLNFYEQGHFRPKGKTGNWILKVPQVFKWVEKYNSTIVYEMTYIFQVWHPPDLQSCPQLVCASGAHGGQTAGLQREMLLVSCDKPISILELSDREVSTMGTSPNNCS